MKFEKPALGLGVLTALASSLCCISPILALLAGTSGIAANFSWVEPFRPYLMGSTVLILGFVWYQKLKPKPIVADCCQTQGKTKTPFMQTTSFLGIATLLTIALTAFPYYSKYMMPTPKTVTTLQSKKAECVEFQVNGMSCESCEHHINSEVQKLTGIQNVKASYANNNTIVEFDPQQVTINQIQQAIDSTGYEILKYKIMKK